MCLCVRVFSIAAVTNVRLCPLSIHLLCHQFRGRGGLKLLKTWWMLPNPVKIVLENLLHFYIHDKPLLYTLSISCFSNCYGLPKQKHIPFPPLPVEGKPCFCCLLLITRTLVWAIFRQSFVGLYLMKTCISNLIATFSHILVLCECPHWEVQYFWTNYNIYNFQIPWTLHAQLLLKTRHPTMAVGTIRAVS